MGSVARPFNDLLAFVTAELPTPFVDSAYLLLRILDGDAPMGLSTGSSSQLSLVALEKLALRGQLRRSWVPQAEVLVTCFPARQDYVPLLAPVIAELRNRGRSVTVALPPGPRIPQHTFADVPAFGLHTLASPTAYAQARSAFSRLRPPLVAFAERYRLDGQRRRYLSIVMQSYCWDLQLFRLALAKTGARVIFGIHYMLDPGIRGAIRSWAARPTRPRTLFIQHGVYSHEWPTHDFHGADRVLLWGDDAVRELGLFPAPRPEAVVTGNPKLEWMRAQQPDSTAVTTGTAARMGLQRVLVLGTNGVPERDMRALVLAATALPESATRTVLFRPHPDEPQGRYQGLMNQGILKPHQVDANPDVYASLRSADVVLGTQSTTLVEAIALGIPAVQLLPDLFELNWAQRGMASASTQDGLRAALDRLRSEPRVVADTLAAARPLAEALFGQVSGAAQRVADAIEVELGSQRPTSIHTEISPLSRS